MPETKNTSNWEQFSDTYFAAAEPKTTKKEYNQGLSITYESGDIYVACNLDLTRTKLKKLEFGRMVMSLSNEIEWNWVKGVFKKNEPNQLKFLQPSWFGEDGIQYEAGFNGPTKEIILEF